jgi:hypothetical protein
VHLCARILVPPIRSRVTYFVALHELGHINIAAAAAWDPDDPGYHLYREASAWSWALDRAIVEPSDRAWRSIYQSWLSHVFDALDAARPSPEWKRQVNEGGAELVPEWGRDWYVATWDRVRSAVR